MLISILEDLLPIYLSNAYYKNWNIKHNQKIKQFWNKTSKTPSHVQPLHSVVTLIDNSVSK